MKKYLVSAFALVALLASCAKENVPATVEEKADAVEIRANIINDDTKTDYSISGNTASFHWTGTETIGRLWYDGSLFGHDAFTSTKEANNGETSLVFRGYFSSDQTAYAMYPIWDGTANTGIGWSSNPFKLYLHESMVYTPDAPLKNVVPMIAKLNAGEFDFVPVTGVIAVTVKNLPSSANKITLSSTGKALSGNYRLTSTPSNYAANIDFVITNGLTITLASNDGNTNGTKSFTFSGLDKGSHVFYFPVSVGTFDDMTITVYAGNTSLQTVKTTKTVTVGKGQIVQFPEMDLAKATKVSITGNANEAYLYVDTFGPDATSVKFAVATTEAAATAAVASGTAITSEGEANKQSIYSGLTSSGKYYLAYSVFDSANNALRSETKTVYFINDSDASQLAGDYTISYSAWTCGALADNDPNLTKRMILAVSNDLSKGNIMMTEFLGYNYDVSESRSTASINWSSPLIDGSPLYGEYPTTPLNDSRTCVSFKDVDSQDGLFSDNAGTYYPRNNASNQPHYHFIVSSPTVLTCVAGTTALAKRSSGAWSGAGTKVRMTNVVATKE